MRRVVVLGLLVFVAVIAACTAQSPDPFTMRVSFDGNEIRFEPDQGAVQAATYALSAEHPGPVFVSDEGVGPKDELLESAKYCFSVEFVDGELVMESFRGTTWREASYGCGGAGTCEFVVSEAGVRGVTG